MQPKEKIRRYPCNCYSLGVCWIVEHPKLPYPISHQSEAEAIALLETLERV